VTKQFFLKLQKKQEGILSIQINKEEVLHAGKSMRILPGTGFQSPSSLPASASTDDEMVGELMSMLARF
jgi:hypothetical protein